MDAILGEIRLFAGTYAPESWFFCDGRLLPISGNEALYSLLGVTWGGDGRTNFALPDLRGRVAVSQGQGTGLTSRVLGQLGGSSTVQVNAANYPSHSHSLFATNQAADTATISAGVGLPTTLSTTSAILSRYADASATGTNAPTVVDMDESSITPAGSAGVVPHNNVMPYLSINYIICYQGTYPNRV